MHLEIVTPEQVLFSDSVQNISLPGTNGEFQVLDNHAAIVATLAKGNIKFERKNKPSDEDKKLFTIENNKLVFSITGGVIELKDNKAIILVD